MFKLTGHNSKTEQSNGTTPNDKREKSTNSTSISPAASENTSAQSQMNLENRLRTNSENESPAISASETMAKDIDEGRLSGYVGHGTTLAGETSFQAMLRVDGVLTGRITSEEGTLIVGTKGQVDANILVATAVIYGKINGDIIATKQLQLVRTAQVIGNIQAPRLVVEDGALLEGSCTMIKAKEGLEQRKIDVEPQNGVRKNLPSEAIKTEKSGS